MKNYIESIGVELEGWWLITKSRYYEMASLYGFHDDISISGEGRFPNEYRDYVDGNKRGYLGEITTGGYTTSDEDIKSLRQFLKFNWPHKTNQWCGFHVHLKVFKPIYHILMSQDFLTFFEQEFKKIATYKTLRDRFTGKSKYCLPYNYSTQQVALREKNSSGIRYTRLNFCYSMHGTFECRAFTMQTTPEVAFSHVLWFVDVTNKYLNKINNLDVNKLLQLNEK